MTSEEMWIQQNVEKTAPRSAPRKNWRLTAKDRRLLLLLMDLLLVNGMLLVSVALWNDFTPATVFSSGNLKWFITITVLWLVVGTVLDVYNLARAASTSSILASVGSAALLTTLLYLTIPWLSPPILRRSYALGLVLLTTPTLTAWRVLYARVLGHTAFRQLGIVVGGDVPAAALKQMLHQTTEGEDAANPFRGVGYEIVGRVVDKSYREANDDLPVLGETQNLVRLIRQYGVDEIILNLEEGQGFPQEAQEVLLDCRELGLRVSSLSSVYERLTGRLPVDYARYDSQLLLSPADTPAFRLYQATKRVLDVLIGLVGALVLGLLIPLVALANALTSPGPLFYRQERLGKGGRPFTVIKFRSMVRDAEKYGAVWCGKNDPRITPIGRFMRKVRLDEVPQFVNVLRGEMSFIGPRPERPHFVGQLSRAFPLYRARHAVRPGITGWAQVHHEYGDSTEDARVKLELDLYYVKHAGFYLDLLTVLHTVRVIVGFKGQ